MKAALFDLDGVVFDTEPPDDTFLIFSAQIQLGIHAYVSGLISLTTTDSADIAFFVILSILYTVSLSSTAITWAYDGVIYESSDSSRNELY